MQKKKLNTPKPGKEIATSAQTKKDDLLNNLFLVVWVDEELRHDGQQKSPVREFRFFVSPGKPETIRLEETSYSQNGSVLQKFVYSTKQDFQQLKDKDEIPNVRQVVFYGQKDTSRPLYVIDSVAAEKSTIECTNANPADLKFEFELTLPFLFCKIQLGFNFQARIDAKKNIGAGCADFRIWPLGKDRPQAPTFDTHLLVQGIDQVIANFGGDVEFINAELVDYKGGDFLTEIGLYQPNSILRFDKIHLTLVGPLAGEAQKSAIYAPACRVRFKPDELSEIFKVIKLKGLGHDKGVEPQDPKREKDEVRKRRISLFEKTINIDSATVKGLDFVQYPQNPLLLNATALKKAYEFLLVMRNVPSVNAHEYWNEEIADAYYTQDVEVSYVPKFAAAPLAGPQVTLWDLAYLVKFNLLADDHDFDFLNQIEASGFKAEPAFNGGLIKWQAFAPRTDYTVSVVFERLITHNNDGLKAANLTLVGHKTPLGTFFLFADSEPFKLAFKGPLVCNTNPDPAKDDKQTVRIGAFDLSFGGTAQANGAEVIYQATVLENNVIEIVARDLLFVVAEVNPGGQDDLPLSGFAEPKQITVINKPCALPTDEEKVRSDLRDLLKDRSKEEITKLYGEYEVKLEARFRREKPLVLSIEKNPKPLTTTYMLNVDETKLDGKHRTIILSLISSGQEETQNLKAVVLDREPFLIAKVQFPFDALTKAGKIEMATWTNASIDGPRWKLNTEAKPFELILPPQAVGEEMEKAKNIDDKERVDFRLGTPAKITLAPSKYTPFKDVGTALQNYTEPPWNLRRLLGDVTQNDPGPFIQHMQVELLYGLSCDIDYPFLRIAEIGSLVGRIPGRLSIPQDIIDNASPDEIREYLLARFDWAVINRRFLSRIAMLIPWNTRPPVIPATKEEDQKKAENTKKTRPVFLINEQARCYIRQAPPGFQRPTLGPDDEPLQLPAEMANPIEPDITPGALKGGATWGFESKNVYDAVMRSEPNEDKKDGFPASEEGKAGEDKNKTDATVLSDLALSSYGGWGNVVAPFDHKRSKISAEVAMGRTFSYEVERIGRIGVFWNRAKHVIVYERTVVRTRQMATSQNELLGRTIVRKVREYVEILQAERSYPDFPLGGAQTAIEGAFIKGCKFEKGQKINVLSSWGADIVNRDKEGNLITQGWMVPLWDPTAEPHTPSDGTTPIPEKELVYPKPPVSLNLEVRSANQESDKAVSTHDGQIEEPQNLFFYTSTMPDEDEDTDKWRPVKNVDYVNLPQAKPCTDFTKAAIQTTPHDPEHHPGYNPVTFKIVSNLPAVNVVAGKGVDPLSAVLRTVTMMRAEYIAEEAVVKTHAMEVVDNLSGLRAKVITDFQNVLDLIPVDPAEAQNALATVQAAITDKIKTLDTLRKDGIKNYLGPVRDAFEKNFEEVKKNIDAAGNFAFVKAIRTLTEVKKDSAGNVIDPAKEGVLVKVKEGYDKILKDPITDIEATRKRVEGYVRLLHEGLIVAEVAPAVLYKPLKETLDRYKNVIERVHNDITRRVQTVVANVDKAKILLEGDINELKAFVDLIDELVAETKKIRVRVPQEWMPDMFGEMWRQYFTEFDTQRAIVKQNIDKTVDEKIRPLLGALDDNKLQQLHKAIEEEIDNPIDALLKSELTPAQKKLTDLLVEFEKAQADLTGITEGWIAEQEALAQKITTTEADAKKLVGELQEYVKAPDNMTPATLDEAINAVKDIGEKHLFKKYKTVVDELKAAQDAAISTLFTDANNAIQPGVDELEALKDKLLKKVKDISKDIRAEVEGLRDELLNQAHAFVSNNIHAIPFPKSDVAITLIRRQAPQHGLSARSASRPRSLT